MRRARNPLDLGDIQGNVLRPYAFPFAAYLFVGVDDAEQGRRWLDEHISDVTTAEPWVGGKPAHTFNVAFTYEGLRALGVPESIAGTFSDAFRQGMAARADLLGDVGPSAPERWDGGLGTGDADVLLTINAQHASDLDAALARLRASLRAAGSGLSTVHTQRAALLPFGREHFGFSDGFSQPDVRYSGAKTGRGQGTPRRFWGWRQVNPGEFVLGYEDEDGVLPEAPGPPFEQNSTYMVYRKLYQDVAVFRTFLHDAAAGDPAREELLAAKIIGRWRDGTPVVLSPDAPDPSIAENESRRNRFRYQKDPDGEACPLGAHIRRSNPRDALGWGGVRTKRHRLIRRGMPYGPPLEADDDDGRDRGLIFIGLNASIERQFEIIQGQWQFDGNIFGLGNDQDLLLGTPERGRLTIQGKSPRYVSPPRSLVTTRGGEYLYVPSLRGLRAVAANLEGWV